MRDSKSIYEARAKMLSQVWICRECGQKIYCGRHVSYPVHICACGVRAWRRLGERVAAK